ncbi:MULTISPECIES: GyrI-like domain-containing protein [unclassified Streptomyces]|uniref:GyrI-like domain-containing protein n=1 Tax=unclassified Streptomyces TaxID=2593676 RepID=UPI00166151D5|nr:MULTISPECIES: GyrI-like domain-containing protein [unclassified Streptomyces]MBD0711479.1 AraC family transcriptional regulator [Streptomyces sp. CBMA291]MBD0716014.1 AraC family transcriptional regulator [Streptomyces sp. CBMA370]
MSTPEEDGRTGGPNPPAPRVVRQEPVTTAVVRGQISLPELRGFFDTSFGTLGRVFHDQRITPLGAAFGLYRGSLGDRTDLEVGFVTDHAVRAEDGVVAATLPEGRVARTTHRGAFDGLGASWERLGTWMRDRGLAPGAERWEVYVTRPSPDMDPRDLRTELNWTIAD